MKEIKLSKFGKNRGKYVAMVDDEDFELLNQFDWCVAFDKSTQTFYAMRGIYPNGIKKTIRMHRAIMDVADRNVFVDHHDHNGLNNQRSNLRIATPAQNMANRKKVVGVSKYLGVQLFNHKKGGKVYQYWRSQIFKNKKSYFLGSFKTETEAALAYNKKAMELHGEFANLNIIQ